MSASPSRRSILQRLGNSGLLVRLVALLLIELLVLGLVFALRWRSVAFYAVDVTEIWVVFGLIAAAMLLGQVFSVFPAGAGHTYSRLGLATFCRTGLPLIVVIAISKYSVCEVKSQPIILVGLFYAVGHFGGMILSASHFNSDVIKPIREGRN